MDSTTSSPRDLSPSPTLSDSKHSSLSLDSGFASGTHTPTTTTSSSPTSSLPAATITLTPSHLSHLNHQLESLSPEEIIRFVTILFPNLYQSTAFGLTGLVTLDMISRMNLSVPLIFLDTLHHFPETYRLVDAVKARYPSTKLHIYRPDGCDSPADFADRYGEKLWETSDQLYDWYAKVEPQARAYRELGVAAVLTGRRRSQGGQRGDIPVIEYDDERGVVKINPLVNWSFQEVRAYIEARGVPYNELLDRGYKSVGDWHSTVPVAEGEDERAGRWKGAGKTECGIHVRESRYTRFLKENAAKPVERAQQQQAVAAV